MQCEISDWKHIKVTILRFRQRWYVREWLLFYSWMFSAIENNPEVPATYVLPFMIIRWEEARRRQQKIIESPAAKFIFYYFLWWGSLLSFRLRFLISFRCVFLIRVPIGILVWMLFKKKIIFESFLKFHSLRLLSHYYSLIADCIVQTGRKTIFGLYGFL